MDAEEGGPKSLREYDIAEEEEGCEKGVPNRAEVGRVEVERVSAGEQGQKY